MDGADESRAILPRVLLDRFRLLEASHQKLKEQFEVLLQEKTRSVSSKTFQEKDVILDSGDATSFPGWETVPGGSFSGSPYRSVLEHLGHAVYVNRTGSGEIIYWNCAAEKLFGYKSNEIVGQRVTKLSFEEECHPSAPEIIERLSTGESWSGQLPLKKKSRQIFMAMVTMSPLYEDGELVGIITVSSDAAIFHNANSGNMRNHHDQANEQSNARRINFKKIQWQPRPRIAAVPQIASSVSNLASKVLSRKREDATCNMCGTTTESEEAGVESHNVKADRPPRAPAVKFFSKLHIGAISNSAKVKNEDIQQNSSDHYFKRKEATFETCHQRGSMKSTPDICNLNAVNQTENFPRGTPCNTERKTPNMHMNPAITSKSCSSGAVPGVRQGSFEVHKSVDQLPRSSSQPEEFHGNVPNIKSSDLEGVSPTPSDSHKIPSSVENVGSVQGSSSSRNDHGTHTVVDSEIRWEDLQLREEIGQGSFAIVYHGVWNGSDVAVKVYCGNQYTEETLLDYRKEIDIMRRLRHPNVLLFMGAICTEEKLAIVTEYMTRGSLFKTLHKSNQSLDVKRRLKMAIDVARGMNYLHHRIPPIVHRDLKSSNLLVDKSWTVKVGDFGLSKLKNTTFLTEKSGRGTPQWMAPEVLRNEPSTEKSDIFSFGVILWELMTERIPWNNLNPLQVVGVVGFMDRRLELPESMDPQVSSIISDCWQSKPEDRPSFEDIIHIMTDLVHSARTD